MAHEWYVQLPEGAVGPLAPEELKRWAAEGRLGPESLVRRGAAGDEWIAASRIKGLLPEPASASVRPAVTAAPRAFGAAATGEWETLRRRARLSLVVAVAGLLAGVSAIALSLLRDPLGRGLGSYDFSTPEGACRGLVEMKSRMDVRAQLEYERALGGNTADEVMRTFEVHRVAEFRDLRVVFYSFVERGKKQREIVALEREPESKLWKRQYLGASDVAEIDAQLAKEMRSWKSDKD